MTIINIASDFSIYPGGRYRTDGKYSGEEFRDDILMPALEKGESIQIELDGTRGYGSSFLEEIFGGLVRRGRTPKLIFEKIKLISCKPALLKEIRDYINGANLS